MTKEQLVDLLIDIDLEYWKANHSEELGEFTRRDAEVAITRYMYAAERLLPLLDQAEARGYDSACRNLVVWNDSDSSLWK